MTGNGGSGLRPTVITLFAAEEYEVFQGFSLCLYRFLRTNCRESCEGVG